MTQKREERQQGEVHHEEQVVEKDTDETKAENIRDPPDTVLAGKQ